jgi:hypothetical protein
MLTSAAVWFAASLVAFLVSPERALWTLFIGAAFIHPLSVLLVKLIGRSGQHAKGNPLGSLAFATTVWLILSCVIAYGVALHDMRWFFPAMMFVIGGRYMTFATLFGLRVFWICGFTLAATAYVLMHFQSVPAVSACMGGAIEAGFAVAILVMSRSKPVTAAHPV